MIDRVLLLLIAGCALFGGVIVVELTSDDTNASAGAPVAIRPEPNALPRAPSPRVDDLLTTILDRPLLSPTRQPAARENSDRPSDPGLGDVRLTGTVIEPGRHLAIFAMPGAKPIARSEGETVNDWRVDSISLRAVVLSGPTGTTTLQPKIDTSLARLAPPPRPAQTPAPAVAPGVPRPVAPAAATAPARPKLAAPAPAGPAPAKPASMPAVAPPGAAPARPGTPAVAPPGAPFARPIPNDARGRE